MAFPATELAGLFPSFTDGEKAVGPAYMTETPGLAQMFFARSIPLQPGKYNIRITVDDAATLWVGSGRNAMRLIQAFRLDEDLSVWTAQFELYEGETRFDIYLQNLTPDASLSCFICAIDRDGDVVYRSSAEFWQYTDDAPMPDSALKGGGDLSRAYPVLTVLPNWRGGVLERVEYLTDVLASEDAKEQRRALRKAPRRTIEAGFTRTYANRARLNNILTGVGIKRMHVPLWFEQYHIPANLPFPSTGYTFPTGSLVMREFRVGDSVLIMGKDADSFDVATVAAVDYSTDRITWGIPPTRSWIAGSRIIPMRVARVTEAMTMDNRTDSTAEVQIRFEIDENDFGFDPSWGHCSPLFRLEPNWNDMVSVTYDRTTFTLDSGVALPFYTDPSDQGMPGQRANFILRRREMTNYLRRFIAMARGRAVRFYVPSYTNDVILAEDIPPGRLYFDAQPSGFWESMKTRPYSRQLLGFYFDDDSAPIYRYVESVEPIGLQGPPYTMTAERFHVDMVLPPIQRRNLRKISWVQGMRFDQDAFELQHEVNDSRVVRTALVFRSVDPTGMPPIDCWTTSPPYPIDDVEMVSTNAEFRGGNFGIDFADSLLSTGYFDGGTLRLPLVTFSTSEGVVPNYEFTGGTIRQLLRAYNHEEPATVTTQAEFSGGVIKKILIVYDRWPAEGLSPNYYFDGGTIT